MLLSEMQEYMPQHEAYLGEFMRSRRTFTFIHIHIRIRILHFAL